MKYKKIKFFLLLTLLIIMLYCYSHPTYYKYNDRWIIGNSITEIEKRYGKFDLHHNNEVAYYISYDNYYYIEYDENGIAVNVFVAGHWAG